MAVLLYAGIVRRFYSGGSGYIKPYVLDKRRGPNLARLGPLYMAGKLTLGFSFLTIRLLLIYKTHS